MMLLDTHALIWYLTNDPQLPDEIKEQISQEPLVYVSSVVIWEIAIKGSLGKLEFRGKAIASKKSVNEIITECLSQEFEFLDVAASHAAEAPFLHGDHKDPFDRLLAAQSLQQGLPLVSCDAVFDRLSPNIRRLWVSGRRRRKTSR